MNNGFLIISVESRKGGVGKTTAALNLARILLEKRGNAVLFLDMDITGTNATDCLDSPFWKEICHAVKENGKSKSTDVNLLALFEQKFMIGLDIPRFIIKGASKNRLGNNPLVLALDKINIIGSQIYNLNDSQNEGNDTCICKPSILFDELHAFWFIEFLQKICEDFMEVVKEDQPNREVAVIVDNSPGYVGIAPAIQEWLTDLGPDRGKFLTVTSLDKQDLLSCGHAIHNLHRLYECKWRASRKFADVTSLKRNTSEDLQLADDEENFFLRLVETPPISQKSQNTLECQARISGADLAFYCENNTEIGGEYIDRPDRYQGLVINRVPPDVKSGEYTYNIEKVFPVIHRKGDNLLNRLLGDNKSTFTNWMVGYDEYIEYQFLQPMISRSKGQMSPPIENNLLHIIKQLDPILHNVILQHILLEKREFTPNMLDEVHIYLRKLHEAVTTVILFIEQNGFSHLTSLIHKEWLPGSILRDFRKVLQSFLPEAGVPFIEFAPWEFQENRVNPDIWELIERFRQKTKWYTLDDNMRIPMEYIEQFLPSLTVIMAFSLNIQLSKSNLGEYVQDLFESIAYIEALHWKRRRNKSKERLSIQRFLAAESLSEREWKEFTYKMKVLPRGLEHEILPRGLEHEILPRLYSACTSAQARLIDVQRDAEFLITLIQRLVMEDIHNALVLPYIRDVAEKVIVQKTMSHESGKKNIAKGFSSVQYMEEFSEVLEKILRKWEIK